MADFGVVTLSVIPVRESSSHRAEMISQLLFGDSFTILQQEPDWLFVRNTFDGYQGWIERKQISIVAEDEFLKWNVRPKFVVNKPLAVIRCDDSPMIIPGGVSLPIEHSFTISNQQFTHQLTKENGLKIASLAMQFINTPYLWGGKTVMGFDCSGFSQIVFKTYGVDLPRDASQQAEIGTVVDFLEEVVAGDLAYFHNSEGNITHVGILISPTQIIHCSGSVRIDQMDHHGIYNKQLGVYTHELRFIKRVI